MNLAAIVNSALKKAGKDKEVLEVHQDKERKELLEDPHHIVEELDEDGSGSCRSPK